MKNIKKLVFLLALFLLFACSDNTNNVKVNNSPIPIETMSVQELDDYEFIKPNKLKPNEMAVKKYKMINKYFKTMKTPTACNRLDNVVTDNYVIVNNEKKKKKSTKVDHSYTIYKKVIDEEDETKYTCQKIKTIKNGTVQSATEFNNKLYFEVNNYIFSDKMTISKFDGKSVKILKSDVNDVTALIPINNYLLFINGGRIDAVDKNDKVSNIKNPDKKKRVYLVYKGENTLNVVYKNKKDGKLSVSIYDLTTLEGKSFNKITDMRLLGSRAFNFEMGQEHNTISQIITAENDKYVVLGDRLICTKDLSRCRYAQIDGESVYGLQDDMVLYMSDRFYISDFATNKKQVISQNPTKYMNIVDNMIYFMFPTADGKDSVYLKYELKEEYN